MPKQVTPIQCQKCGQKYRVKARKGGKKPSRGCPVCGFENVLKALVRE